MSTIKEMENSVLFNNLDAATSIFLAINTAHTVELINKKGCEILGYGRDEILGKDWFQNFIPQSDRKELALFFDQVVNCTVVPPENYENWVLTKGNIRKLIRWHNTLFKDNTGKISGLICSGMEVTAQAMVERELKAHEEGHDPTPQAPDIFLISKSFEDILHTRNRALEAAGNGIVIVDAQQSKLPIIYCNRAFTEITGYSKEEVIGINCQFLQNDDRDQEAIESMAQAIRKGEPCRVVLRNYRKDGTLFWNELSITPLYNDQNQLTHFIGVQNDVTEMLENRKRLENYTETLELKIEEHTKELQATVQKLVETNLSLEDQIVSTKIAQEKARASHAMFAAIAQNFPKGIIVVFNADYELVYIEGEELERIALKKSDFEGFGIDVAPFFTELQKVRIREDITKTLSGTAISSEVYFQGQNYMVNSTPLYSEHKEIVWALFVYNNVTEQKRVQQKLERTLKAEQELNDLKSRFVSMASHEFRTPLSAILSSAILIGKQNGPGMEERREKHVSRIRNNVKSLVVILNDFLSLDMLDAGKVKVSPKRFELIQFLKLLVEEMEGHKKEGQLITLDHPKRDLLVYLDPKLLSHILINLLSNAMKYSEEGQEITMKISRKTKQVSITITDQGMGIPLGEQKKLFERFFRAANVTNIQGTGLGLHIVKQYTELLGGTIGFMSKIGTGTSFTLKLPLDSKLELPNFEENLNDK